MDILNMENLEKYLAMAKELGFTNAVPIESSMITCEEEIRGYCNPVDCDIYGTNWVCPPACGTFKQCAQRIYAHNRGGLLMQTIAELDTSDYNAVEQVKVGHQKRLRRLADSFQQEFPEALPLAVGGCTICPRDYALPCAFPDPCRQPDRRMHSLSAHGINVGNLCKAAGLPYGFIEGQVYFVACLLI